MQLNYILLVSGIVSIRITKQQILFCWIYALTGNGAKSARMARYKREYGKIAAYKLLKKKHIIKYISFCRNFIRENDWIKEIKIIEMPQDVENYKEFSILKGLKITRILTDIDFLFFDQDEIEKLSKIKDKFITPIISFVNCYNRN